jgi:hypothetical protein
MNVLILLGEGSMMSSSVKYRENTLAFLYGIFAALAAGTAWTIFSMAGFEAAALNLLQMAGLVLVALLMVFFFFRAFQQSFWGGVGGFLMIPIGVVALASVLFLPGMLKGEAVVEEDAALEVFLTPSLAPTDEIAEAAQEEEGTAAQEECLLWSSVDSSMVGEDICVYGNLARANSREGVFYMLFVNEPGRFFLMAYNWGDSSLAGSCVKTRGVVQRLGASPVIVVAKQADLEACD